jgi:hypothetical protein
MKNEIVQFVSAKPYLNCSDEEFNKVFFCLHGRKEVVVECSSELKEILKNLPSDYLQPRLIDIKDYLNKNGIGYIENFKNTTIV